MEQPVRIDEVMMQLHQALANDESGVDAATIVTSYLRCVELITKAMRCQPDQETYTKLSQYGKSCFDRINKLSMTMGPASYDALKASIPCATPERRTDQSELATNAYLTRSEQRAVVGYDKAIAYYKKVIQDLQGGPGHTMDRAGLATYKTCCEKLSVIELHRGRMESMAKSREEKDKTSSLMERTRSRVGRVITGLGDIRQSMAPEHAIDEATESILKEIKSTEAREDALSFVYLISDSIKAVATRLNGELSADDVYSRLFAQLMPAIRGKYAIWLSSEIEEYRMRLAGFMNTSTSNTASLIHLTRLESAESPISLAEIMQSVVDSLKTDTSSAEDLVVLVMRALMDSPDVCPIADCAIVEDLAPEELFLDGSKTAGVAAIQEATARIRRSVQ
ncbi:hypothetical protein J8273_2851 [Carpediemonas membranifera]|uniref:Uncharacterized protein n=1 Tax=Carpediemonas membranifera TaxID=201153 RepID=A0A8J6E5E5_9EUKA|nr:hypothetical protein J8273_2851 [Carpediemonas membranifera]|eukprot:KAG9395647.1 hypothetical protein J8273_2851 [Carpediemonas membranifera]